MHCGCLPEMYWYLSLWVGPDECLQDMSMFFKVHNPNFQKCPSGHETSILSPFENVKRL